MPPPVPARYPRGSYKALPLLSLEVAIPEIKLTHRSCHPCASPLHKRFLVGCSSPFLHATRRTPHGASRLVQATSGWSMKVRHAPFRHSRDARVNKGLKTTAMHEYRVHRQSHFRCLHVPLSLLWRKTSPSNCQPSWLLSAPYVAAGRYNTQRINLQLSEKLTKACR